MKTRTFSLRLVIGLHCLLGVDISCAADGPGPGFQQSDLESPTVSPDQSIRVEQYFKPGEDYVFQFWTFDQHHQHPNLLNPGETGSLTEYGAGFRFSADSQWLIRIQKIAAGESTLFLYKRNGFRFVPATVKPLGDLAWDYFFTRPDSKNIDRSGLSPETYLIQGMDDNYARIGEHWPNSRYIVLSLCSGESGTPILGPWRCVYDTKTGTFSVPPDFAKFNLKAKESNK